jgi:hypothetical protein
VTRHPPSQVITGWRALLLAPFLVPVILCIKLVERLFGRERRADLTVRDVESYPRNIINGTGDEWDWDDFTCIPLSDPRLEELRIEAGSICLPADEEGMAHLHRLLARVQGMN